MGAKDDQALPDVNAKPMAAAIPRAELEVLPGVTHYTFLATCSFIGRFVARQYCVDPGDVDRGAIHGKVSAEALKFFGGALKADVRRTAARR